MKDLRQFLDESHVKPDDVPDAPRYCPKCQQVPATTGAAFCGKCGTRLVVQTAQFGGQLTPTFSPRQKMQRIFFACFAAPIIGLGIGANLFAWLGIFLSSATGIGSLSGLFAVLGFLLTTALIAYIILSDKTTLLDKIVTRLRRRELPPQPREYSSTSPVVHFTDSDPNKSDRRY